MQMRILTVCALLVPTITGATELRAPASDVFHQDVAWSPDGEWIAFSELDLSGGEYKAENWSLFVARADGSAGRRRIADHALYVTWSPDGRQLAYGSGADGQWDLFRINVSDFETTRPEPVRLTTDSTDERQPAWSPDGERIAYTSNRLGWHDVFVLDLNYGISSRITFDSLKDYTPQWSPDGEWLVFYKEKADGQDDIYVAAADGSDSYSVTNDSALNIFPCFSSDTTVAFSRSWGDDEDRLVEVALDGSDRRYVTKLPTFFARWSHDGSRIAFISGSWPQSAIYIMRSDGTDARKVVN